MAWLDDDTSNRRMLGIWFKSKPAEGLLLGGIAATFDGFLQSFAVQHDALGFRKKSPLGK